MISTSKAANIILTIIAANSSSAFTAAPRKISAFNSRFLTQQELFGNAFANDDSLGERENAGLKKVMMRCRIMVFEVS